MFSRIVWSWNPATQLPCRSALRHPTRAPRRFSSTISSISIAGFFTNSAASEIWCVYGSNASPVDLSDVYAHSAAPDSSLPVRWWNVTRYSLQNRREKMGRMQFECSNGRHGRLGRLERLVRITQAAASSPPSRSCRPITLLLRGDTRQFQICSRKPRIPKDAGRSARSHARPKSVRLADHHIVHKVSTRQLVEFSHGNPYQACSPPCSLRSYPSDCECLLNERGEYPVKTFGQLPDSVFKSYPDRWRSNIRFTSAPHRWHRYTTSSSSSPGVGIVGVTSDTLIGMRHLGQSWTSPAHIVLGSAVMGRLLHWTNSALEWSFDQEGSRALQHSCLC